MKRFNKYNHILALLLFLLISGQYKGPYNPPTSIPTDTVAALTLYVDPTGSDGNACTAPGTSACRTFNGTMAKLPHGIRYATTVNVAAGTYAETPRILDFDIEGPNNTGTPTAALTIQGVLVDAGVSTGFATGTATAYVGMPPDGDNTKAHLTDTNQIDGGAGWTVNELTGQFLEITAGTGVGQRLPIVSNTASVIYLASPFDVSPVAGSAYAVRTTGTNFTNGSLLVRSLTGHGKLTLQFLGFTPPTGVTATVINVRGPVLFESDRFITGNSAAFFGTGEVSEGLLIQHSYLSARTSGLTLGGGGISMPVSVFQCLISCGQASCAGTGVSFFAGSRPSSHSGTVTGTWATGVQYTSTIGTSQSGGLWIDCGSDAGVGLLMNFTTGTPASFAADRFYVNGCGVGVKLLAPSSSSMDSMMFTNNTTAVQLNHGARMFLDPVGVQTFTSNGTDFNVEGTTSTYANFHAADGGFGPRIIGAEGSVLTGVAQ